MPLRTFDHRQFGAEGLAAAKRGHIVSVCLPARDEEATVGAIVTTIRQQLLENVNLVDEILVVDDHSSDRTTEAAAAAGARVVHAADVLPAYGEGHGKGEAMWKSLHEADGDLIVWCDADVIDFSPHFVTGILGPLLTCPGVDFVKGCYDRPAPNGDRGGRVTELVARPLLALLFPHLAGLAQPLAGEYGGRRSLLEQLPFVDGYGVDIALLIDIAARFGADAIAEVDLGTRRHRNRPLDELSPQALAVMQTALRRGGRLAAVDEESAERPPLATVPEYAKSRAARDQRSAGNGGKPSRSGTFLPTAQGA